MIRDGKPVDVSGHAVLSRLKDGRVFYFEKSEADTFLVWEGCDDYFCEQLTRDEMLILAKEIQAVAENQ